MDAQGIPPTYPFHLAKAYAPAAPTSRLNAAANAPSIDSVELSKLRPQPRAQPRAESIDTLVAGKVKVSPNFAPAPAKSTEAFPLYRHPADKNTAATGVKLGDSIDTTA